MKTNIYFYIILLLITICFGCILDIVYDVTFCRTIRVKAGNYARKVFGKHGFKEDYSLRLGEVSLFVLVPAYQDILFESKLCGNYIFVTFPAFFVFWSGLCIVKIPTDAEEEYSLPLFLSHPLSSFVGMDIWNHSGSMYLLTAWHYGYVESYTRHRSALILFKIHEERSLSGEVRVVADRVWIRNFDGDIVYKPIYIGDRIIVPLCNEIVCLDSVYGTTLWKFEFYDIATRGVAIFKEPFEGVIVPCSSGRVYCVNASCGEPVWRCDLSCYNVNYVYDACIWNGKVFLVDYSAKVFCIDLSNGKVMWRRRLGGGEPLIFKPCIFATPYGIVVLLPFKKGMPFTVLNERGRILWNSSKFPGRPREYLGDGVLLASFGVVDLIERKIYLAHGILESGAHVSILGKRGNRVYVLYIEPPNTFGIIFPWGIRVYSEREWLEVYTPECVTAYSGGMAEFNVSIIKYGNTSEPVYVECESCKGIDVDLNVNPVYPGDELTVRLIIDKFTEPGEHVVKLTFKYGYIVEHRKIIVKVFDGGVWTVISFKILLAYFAMILVAAMIRETKFSN